MIIWRPPSAQDEALRNAEPPEASTSAGLGTFVAVSIVAVAGLFIATLAGARVGMMFLGAVVLLLLLASWRFVRITRRVRKLGFRPSSDSASDAACAVAGVIGYLALVAALLVAWGAIGLTAGLLILAPGTGSGLGLAVAILVFLPLYAISEAFLYFWLRRSPDRPSGRE